LSALACFVIGASLGFFGGKKSPAYTRAVPQDPILREFQHDSNVTRTIALSGFGCGLAILFGLWASGILPNGSTISFFALACFAIGSLLGFLFGIPRVLQKSSQPDPGQPRLEQGNNLQPRSSYQLLVNTNLDDVSDWLTKIVVGVSLVELRKIPGLVQRLAFFIDPAQQALIVSVLVYFSTVGFLGGYLNTRMFIQRAFRLADLDAEGGLDASPRDSNGSRNDDAPPEPIGS
jgi:hypothetical protein